MTHTNPQSWRERFDHEFSATQYLDGVAKNIMKEFIATEITAAEARTREQMHHEYEAELTAREKVGEDRGTESERTRIARLIADAGNNKISLLNEKDEVTGTYWISANMLYFLLMGRHLNKDIEDGIIPENKFFRALQDNK